MQFFKKNKLRRFLPLIGVVLIAFILLKSDLKLLAEVIKNTNYFYFLVSLLIAVPNILIKSYKWKLIINSFGCKDYPYVKSVKHWLAGFSMGVITPGHIGDLYRGLYLKKYGLKTFVALVTVLLDRLVDIITLLALGFFGFGILASKYFFSANVFILPMLLMVALSVFGLGAFYSKTFAVMILKPFYRVFLPMKYKKKAKTGFNDLYDKMVLLRKEKSTLLLVVLIAFFCWFLFVLQYYFLGLGIGLNVSFYGLFLVLPIVIILEVLPISFGGLGPREAGLIFFLGLMGVIPEKAIALGLMMFFVNMIIVAFSATIIFTEKKLS